MPIGYDKRQIADDIEGPIIFFGDKMAHGGNDYPLAKALRHQRCYEVKNWRDTFERLQFFTEAKIAS